MAMNLNKQKHIVLLIAFGCVAGLQSGLGQLPGSQSKLEVGVGLTLQPRPADRPLMVSKPFAVAREWEVTTLQEGYRRTGVTNRLWDADVKRAFDYYADSIYGGLEDLMPLRQATKAAIAAGCQDPMIQYFRVRYETAEPLDLVRAFDAMLRSQYHPRHKFLSGLRAVEATRNVNREKDRSSLFNWTTICLEDYARDTNAPMEELLMRANLWLDHANTKSWHDAVGGDLIPILDRGWGSTERGLVFLGQCEIRKAWDERGRGYADRVNDAGWKEFEGHLRLAEKHLLKAWQMNSNRAATAYEMMRVELGQGVGLPRMREWFDKAMALNTNHYDAAKLMAFYLEPRWYGSEATCLNFCRTCVTSTEWGGEVPLVLANTHRSLATYYSLSNSPAYWQRPRVWPDIKAAYERFFKLNPKASSWRHNYALDAYNCGQYSVFLKQTQLFSNGTNYNYFGGQAAFVAMLEKAAAVDKTK